MTLCFGTYAKVLTLFLKEGKPRKELIHTIVRAVDPTCTLSDNAVSQLLSCQSNLPGGRANGLGQVKGKAKTANAQEVARYFSSNLPELLVHNDRQLIILALCDIIFQDDSISGDTVVDDVGGLTKDTLRNRHAFALADFLAGVFLYVADVDNRGGKHVAAVINRGYVDSFSDKVDTVSFTVNKRASDKRAADESFIEYMVKAKMKYANMKTLLYMNEPKPFYNFYVPNNVEHRAGRALRATLTNVTVESLTAVSNFIILNGTGGLGKSMMLRHLLLDAIEKYDSFRHVPVFISLKDYDGLPIDEFIYSRVKALCDLVSRKALDSALSNGLCLLLFDGLDKMNSECGRRFESELEDFVDKYPKNHYVISSRPYQMFTAFSRFVVLNIMPFTKK